MTENSYTTVIDNPNADQIADYYIKMGRSVNLLNTSKPNGLPDADWQFIRSQNIAWLQLMVSKDFWTTEDMSAINAAIAEG